MIPDERPRQLVVSCPVARQEGAQGGHHTGLEHAQVHCSDFHFARNLDRKDNNLLRQARKRIHPEEISEKVAQW